MLRPRTKYVMMYVIAFTAGKGRSALSHDRPTPSASVPSANKGTPGMAHRLLKIAAVYFVLAVCLGTYMGATQDLTFLRSPARPSQSAGLGEPRHHRLHLSAEAAPWPRRASHRCISGCTISARRSCWSASRCVHSGGYAEIGGPIAGIFSIVTVIGIICFAVNLWRGSVAPECTVTSLQP